MEIVFCFKLLDVGRTKLSGVCLKGYDTGCTRPPNCPQEKVMKQCTERQKLAQS